MTRLDLYSANAECAQPEFGFDPKPGRKTAADKKRLDTLQGRVEALMSDGQWRTLREIADAARGGEASVSARLREIRAKGGDFELRARGNRADGLFEYRVTRAAP
jgi:hypothetical protein